MGHAGGSKPRLLFGVFLAAILMGMAVSPAPAQVSSVPPGLVLPIGTAIKTWESGATDFSEAGTVNRILAYKNSYFSEVPQTYYAPFPANQGVPAIMPSQPLYFVRMYAPAASIGQVGSWVMRAAEVRGLTPEQIRDRFALPAVPTNITYVVVPPNVAALWTGYAGPIAQFGAGGGQQSYIMSRLTTYYYNQANPAEPLLDYTNNGGELYGYIPLVNYIHGQALGSQALSYKPFAGGGKAGQVAAYLDRFIPQPYSDLEAVYTLLDYLNYPGYGPGPLQAAMRQISPERYDAFSTLGVRSSLLFGDTLMQRSQTLRLGLAGGDGASTADVLESLGRLAQMASVCGFSDPRMVTPGMLPSQVSRRGIGVWGRGVGEFGNQGGSGDRTGFAYKTGGFVGGVDWQPRQDLVLGFGAAYLGTTLGWDQSGGNAKVSYAKFGLYGSYFTPRFFMDGVFEGGVNWTAAQRQIGIPNDDNEYFPGLLRTATSSQTGHDFAMHWRGGVNFTPWNWCLTPMAQVSYFYLQQHAFDEQGAGGLNLSLRPNQAQTLRSALGARLARTFTTLSGTRITPEASIGWAHYFALDNRVINAGLLELGGSFATDGFNGDTDSLLVGVGVTAQLTSHVALSGRYLAEFGPGFLSQIVNLGLRCEF